METNSQFQRPTLKSMLTTDDYKDFFLNKSLVIGTSSGTKPLRVQVAPDTEPSNALGNRVVFKIPRYHFLNGIALQLDLNPMVFGESNLSGGNAAASTGYLRVIGSLIKRMEISHGAFRYVVPEDFVTQYFLLTTETGDLDRRLRYVGGVVGTNYHGNTNGGTYEIDLPSPFEKAMFPLCAMNSEIVVEIEFKNVTDGIIEDTDGKTDIAIAGSSLKVLKPRLVCKVVNADEAVVSETIARVKSTGIAIPYNEIGFLHTDFTPTASGARVNLSQLTGAGLIHTLAFSVRQLAKVRTNNGSASVLRPTALRTNAVNFYVELNNNRLYSNTELPLLVASSELQDKYGAALSADDLAFPALSGIFFGAGNGKAALLNQEQTGYVDATGTSAFDIVFGFNAITAAGDPGNTEWYAGGSYQKMYLQCMALAHNILIVGADGIRRVSA